MGPRVGLSAVVVATAVAVIALGGHGGLAAPGLADAAAGGSSPVARNCDDGAPFFKYKRKLVDLKPTSLKSSYADGPADLVLHRGRSGTISVTLGNSNSDGIDLGVDFKGIKAGWNDSHSNSLDIARSATMTVSEAVRMHVRKHQTARIVLYSAVMVIKIREFKTQGPHCHVQEVGHAKVIAPFKHPRFVYKLDKLN